MDETSHDAVGESRRTDYAESVWTAGAEPPPSPSADEALVGAVGAENLDDTCYLIRVAIDGVDDEYGRRVVDELRTELEVLATTYECDEGPTTPGQFDVLVATEYHPTSVADALVEPADIAGVAICPAAVAVPDGAGTDDDAVGEALPDVDAGDGDGARRSDAARPDEDGDSDAVDAESPPQVDAGLDQSGVWTDQSDAVPGEDDGGASADQPADEPGDRPAVESDDPPAVESDDPPAVESDDPPADEPGGQPRESAEGPDDLAVFEALKAENEPVAYDDLIEELDEATFPGEFSDDADLEPLLSDANGDETDTGDDESRERDAGTNRERDAGDAPADGDVELVGNAADGGIEPDDVVEALVRALEEDALTDEQRAVIVDELDAGPPKTLQVRVDHLQRELDELTAYKDSLESFIDTYGVGEGLIERIRDALEEVQSDVSALAGDVRSLNDRLGSVEDDVDAVGGVRSELGDVRSRVDDLASQVAGLESSIDDLEDVESRLASLEELAAGVEDSVEDVGDRVDELEALGDRVDELESSTARAEQLTAATARLERLSSEVEDLAAVDARLDAVEADLREELADVRESTGPGDVEQRLDELERQQSEIVDRFGELVTWRERLLSAMTAPDEELASSGFELDADREAPARDDPSSDRDADLSSGSDADPSSGSDADPSSGSDADPSSEGDGSPFDGDS